MNKKLKIALLGTGFCSLVFSSTFFTAQLTTQTNAASTITLWERATIRDAKNEQGLRFEASIDNYKSSSSYYMAIVPSYWLSTTSSNYLEKLKGKTYAVMPCKPYLAPASSPFYSKYNNKYVMQGALSSIKDFNNQIDFTCIPYEVDSNGNITYATNVKDVKANLYDVCKYEYARADYSTAYGEETKQFISSVIYSCENHTTKTSLNNVKAYFINNTDRVYKNVGLPDICNTSLQINVAKGEAESGQLILNLGTATSKKYFVYFEPFVSTSNSKTLQLDKVEIYKELYQRVDSNWVNSEDEGSCNYYHGYYGTPRLGYCPDAILPFDVAINANENYLDQNNGSNNGVYFKLKVPRNAESGTYKSKMIVKVANEGTLALPITLKVNSFEMPKENQSSFTIIYNNSYTKQLYSDVTGSGNKNSPFSKTAHELLADDGISGGNALTDCWDVKDLPTYVESIREYAKDSRIKNYFIQINYLDNVSVTLKYKKNIYSSQSTINMNKSVIMAKDYPYSASNTVAGLESVLTALVEGSTNECDLIKKGYIYHPQADEPCDNQSYLQNILNENVVRKSVDYVLANCNFENKENVKKSLQNLHYFVTAKPNSLLNGDLVSPYSISLTSSSDSTQYCYCSNIEDFTYRKVTGYCPLFHNFDYTRDQFNTLFNMIDDENYYVINYGCIFPIDPYPSLETNASLNKNRSHAWFKNFYKIEGELYYTCNRVKDHPSDEEDEVLSSEEKILETGIKYSGASGDGQLLYPVYRKYNAYDSNLYWLKSLRLEALSEANDDYNYLYLAKELISKLSSSEQTEKTNILNNIFSLVIQTEKSNTSPYYNSDDSDTILNARNQLIQLIESIN